jgi:hypothetical protein
MGRQSRHVDIDVSICVPAATPVKINGGRGGED